MYKDGGSYTDLTALKAEDALVDHECSSTGYAEAFQLLCVTEGIPCDVLFSYSTNYAFNICYLDGEWTYVDIARDSLSKYKPHSFSGKLFVGKDKIDGQIVFRLYDTYGFPPEVTKELAEENGMKIDLKEFDELFKQHQEKSRSGSEQKFKGGLAEQTEETICYHTATHLLNAALKVVIGKDVHQKGSNITTERMRFDFSCDHKLTDEEKQKVEDLVNEWIKDELPVTKTEMKKEDAIKSGAECMFIEKYPDVVTVYSIGDVSKELCGGPHVTNTSELGQFKIKKEEASSAGVRRIKAVLIK